MKSNLTLSLCDTITQKNEYEIHSRLMKLLIRCALNKELYKYSKKRVTRLQNKIYEQFERTTIQCYQ